MTPERCSMLLPIMQAYAKGQIIQKRYPYETSCHWLDCCNANFNSDDAVYRVKPPSVSPNSDTIAALRTENEELREENQVLQQAIGVARNTLKSQASQIVRNLGEALI